MSKLILLIEDNEEEQRIFSTYLQFVGGNVAAATDGMEGLRLAETRDPDLILLDMRLPGMDGWEVMRRLQSRPATSEIPVVAITGLPLRDEELEEAGFCGYLKKPVTPFHVLEEVERCLGRVSQSDERRSHVGTPYRR